MVMNVKRKDNLSRGQYMILGGCAVAMLIVCLIYNHFAFYQWVRLNLDAHSYIEAADRLSALEPDVMRTPVYPFIILITRALFGELWIYAVAAIQFIVMVVAGYYLSLTGMRYIGRRGIVTGVVGAVLLTAAVKYCVNIQTEAFAVSGVIFLVWTLVRDLPGAPNMRSILLSGVWMILLIFLRPAFLYLLPVYLLYFAVVTPVIAKDQRMRVWTSVTAMVLLTAGLISLYRQAIHERYDIMSISHVTTINNFVNLRNAGIVEPEQADDEWLRSYLEEHKDNPPQNDIELSKEMNKINTSCTPAAMERYVMRVMDRHKTMMITEVWRRWSDMGGEYEIFSLPVIKAFSPTLRFYMLFMIVCAAVIAFRWRKGRGYDRRYRDVSILLLAICAGLLATTIVGADKEYSRLNLPAFPLWLLLAGRALAIAATRTSAETDDISLRDQPGA